MHTNAFTRTDDGTSYTALPSGGTLFIAPVEGERAACPLSPNDVLVLDDRRAENPSFQVRDSYAVRTSARQREILDAIIAFDRASPAETPWNRSMESLVREWKLHNLAYRLHVYRKSSASVDLDNHDEGKGYLRFFITSAERALTLLYKKCRQAFGK